MSTPVNKPKQKYATGCMFVLLSACFVVFAVFLLLLDFSCRMQRASTIGRAMSLSPSRFTVLVFPRRTEHVHPVQRAVLLRLEEFNSDTFEVRIGGKPVMTEATEFQALPDEATVVSDIAALNQEIVSWGADTDWKKVEYSIDRHGNNGESMANLTITDNRRARFVYHYRITADGKITPVSGRFHSPY